MLHEAMFVTTLYNTILAEKNSVCCCGMVCEADAIRCTTYNKLQHHLPTFKMAAGQRKESRESRDR